MMSFSAIRRCVVILVGPSGCGKSTFASCIQTECNIADVDSVVCSADDFRMVNGEYVHDPSQHLHVHGRCKALFLESLADRVPVIIVDNTNTKLDHMMFYVDNAFMRGYPTEVVMFEERNTTLLAERNSHGTPISELIRQSNEIGDINKRAQEIMKRWPEVRVSVKKSDGMMKRVKKS